MMPTTSPIGVTVEGLLWLAAVGVPLLLAVLLGIGWTRVWARRLAPLAPMPALLFSWVADPAATVSVPWLLLGARAGIDETARMFLLFTAVLWSLATAYALPYLKDDSARCRFLGFFLVTMSGNLGLILARDIVSFYLFFALMSFAAYGLVIHNGTDEARRAGTVYVALVIVAEALLVPALVLSAAAAGSLDLRVLPDAIARSPERDLIIGLVLAGFGIKAGALPLHVWLPLAHPVAPTPASAVLSGALIKAGLLGWLRFLPLGVATLSEWGAVCVVMGMAAAFYGVMVGLLQSNPKTVLAYSSISQMGLITVGIGVGLLAPGTWPFTLTAVTLYAIHHGLAKGALFLGVGVAERAGVSGTRRRWIGVGLLLPALALAGAPLTSGALSKLWLKEAAASAPPSWATYLGWMLPLAAVATTLLMARVLHLVWHQTDGVHPRSSPALLASWTALLTGVVCITWLAAPTIDLETVRDTLAAATVWPVMLGTMIAWVFTAWRRRPAPRPAVSIPAGDVLVLMDWMVSHARKSLANAAFTPALAVGAHQWFRHASVRFSASYRLTLVGIDDVLARWRTAGVILLVLVVVLFALRTTR